MIQKSHSTREQLQSALPEALTVDSTGETVPACDLCPAHKLGICEGFSTNKEREGLSGNARPFFRTSPRNSTILHPKETYDSVPIICTGWAASVVALSDGRRQVTSFLLSGDPGSIVALFEPVGDRCIEAVTALTYRRFDRSKFREALRSKPAVLDDLLKDMAEERQRTEQTLVALGRSTAAGRIAQLILSLASRMEARKFVVGNTFEFPLRQRQIADATGLTSVHVSKMLGDFQASNIIEINERVLTIIDRPALVRLAAA